MTNENDQEFINLVKQYPSIKIVKNTKGYTFQFKVLSNDVEEMDRVHNAIVKKIKDWETANE